MNLNHSFKDWAIIDIETIPNQELGEIPMPEGFVKYGNTKDPDKKEIYKYSTRYGIDP